MNLMATSLVFIFFISNVYALSINIPTNTNIYSNSEFKVFIDSVNNNQQDVRFFLNTSNSTLYVYENNWRNAFRYVLGSFPKIKNYNLKISDFGEKSLCVRFRETNNPKKTESICTTINILEEKKEFKEKNITEDSIILLSPKDKDPINKNSKVIYSKDYINKLIIIFSLNILALICVFLAFKRTKN